MCPVQCVTYVSGRSAAIGWDIAACFAERSLPCGPDFACGLPLRSRPQHGSSSNPLAPAILIRVPAQREFASRALTKEPNRRPENPLKSSVPRTHGKLMWNSGVVYGCVWLRDL